MTSPPSPLGSRRLHRSHLETTEPPVVAVRQAAAAVADAVGWKTRLSLPQSSLGIV